LDFAIFVGSCEEYGNGKPPFIETQEPIVFSPYGWGKIASYQAIKLICTERKINYCWIRPFLTFGPQQSSKSIIPSVILSCLKNENIALTPGEQTRDFIYVEDICEMFRILIKNHKTTNNEIFNLCSGIPRTISSVTHLIQNKIGTGKLLFGKVPYRPNEAMSFYGSNTKFNKYFGEVPLHDFESAIDLTIQSYKSNFTNEST
jgi:nucleoside-diphosphate-sugar epimerase